MRLKSDHTEICWATSAMLCARKGLRMGIYYSLYEWYNPLWLYDKPRYVREHMFPQFKDVVTHYKPSIIFSDGEWEHDIRRVAQPGVAGLAVQRFAGQG